MSCIVKSAAGRCSPALYVSAPTAEFAWPIARTASISQGVQRGTAGIKKKLRRKKRGEPEP